MKTETKKTKVTFTDFIAWLKNLVQEKPISALATLGSIALTAVGAKKFFGAKKFTTANTPDKELTLQEDTDGSDSGSNSKSTDVNTEQADDSDEDPLQVYSAVTTPFDGKGGSVASPTHLLSNSLLPSTPQDNETVTAPQAAGLPDKVEEPDAAPQATSLSDNKPEEDDETVAGLKDRIEDDQSAIKDSPSHNNAALEDVLQTTPEDSSTTIEGPYTYIAGTSATEPSQAE